MSVTADPGLAARPPADADPPDRTGSEVNRRPGAGIDRADPAAPRRGTKPTHRLGTAEDRIVRTFARFLGAAGLLFGVLLAPGAVALSIVPVWWTVTTGALVLVPLLALLPASRAADTRWIRRSASAAAIGYLLGLLWFPLVADGHIPPNRDIWVTTFPGLITMAAALRWRPRTSLMYLAAAVSAAEVVRYVARAGQEHVVLPVEIASTLVFCGLFVVATIAAVQTGRALDRAVEVSVSRSATAAAHAAQDVERSRFHALIHDRVMSVLLGLARQGATPEMSEQAAIAVAELDALRDSTVADEGLDIHTAVGLIRAALVKVDGDVPVEVEIDTAALTVPRLAARAIASAAAEALRNSVRHADTASRAADRLVAIDADQHGVRVIVADNGCGFDPGQVPGYQLGITMSIRERMATADGCAVDLRSAPGDGTQVTLLWSAAT
ncbi:sensor histidine kinase [Rhodococcus sp. NPDC054953]